jgi:hypothetical protein
VTSLKRRLRSLLIAFAVLALSAGVALGGRGADLSGTDATGATVHSDPAEPDDQTGQAGDEDAEAPETEAPETEAPETDAPDEGQTTAPQDAPTTAHPDNHGLLVSEAAQAPTDPGTNHGAAVRLVAMANNGHVQAAAAKTKHAPKAPH